MPFASAEELILEISRGGMVILIDDAHRENEGDLIVAAQSITPEQVNFLATHARGLICAPLAQQITDRLELSLIVLPAVESPRASGSSRLQRRGASDRSCPLSMQETRHREPKGFR